VLTNLVGNAVKFTDQGDVIVSATLEDGEAPHVRVTVRDTGIGIKQDDLERLFEAFSQVDASLTRQHGGTGLGLVICKRLVELWGGRVGVESEYGSGSTFWFTIPLSGEAAEALVSQSLEGRVLLVQHSPAYREILTKNLTRWGLRVVVAEPEEAAEEASRKDDGYQLVIVDLREAGEELELLSTIRRKNSNMPIMLLAPLDAALLPTLGSSALVDRLITKPIRLGDLASGVRRLLSVSAGRISGNEKHSSGGEIPVPAGQTGIKLLVAEDNEINREVIHEMLVTLGYEADLVGNGRQALAALDRSDNYDAVLMDCQMPELDGYEATRLIRRRPGALGKIPVIAVTAHAIIGEREKALACGMNDCLTKPINARALRAMLELWVRARHVRPSTIPPEAASGSQRLDSPALDPSVRRSATVIALFRKHAPVQLEELRAASGPEAVKRAAHKLKGTCLVFGMPRASEICIAIEENPNQAEQLMRVLEGELGRAQAELDKLSA
jgi:CheY-like chemotaxis protein